MLNPKTLYVASTPIGNLKDMSERLLCSLKSADIIACEDTRVSKKLLSIAGGNAALFSHHKFNEIKTLNKLINFLKEGKNILLLSDAGTPCISDPGYKIVDEAYKNNFNVISIPGPSSVTASLSISGFDCKNFIFLSFLPKGEEKIKNIFLEISDFEGAIVFFESPNRIMKTINILSTFLQDDTRICLCKEISKVYENVIRGHLSKIRSNNLISKNEKGEWTIIIEKLKIKKNDNFQTFSIDKIQKEFNLNRAKAAKILSIITGKSKKDFY